jgi:hypothetical protein
LGEFSIVFSDEEKGGPEQEKNTKRSCLQIEENRTHALEKDKTQKCRGVKNENNPI